MGAADLLPVPRCSQGRALAWSEAGDCWLLLATAVGLKVPTVEGPMGAPYRRGAANRLNTLREDGRFPAPAWDAVLYAGESGPAVVRLTAVALALSGSASSPAGRNPCRRDRYYVMDAWLTWRRLEEGELIHRLRYSNAAAPSLRERYAELRQLGIDPFCGDVEGRPVRFRLPINWRGVYQLLQRDPCASPAQWPEEQTRRVVGG